MLKSVFCLVLSLSTAGVYADDDADFNEDLASIGADQLAEDAKEDAENELAWSAYLEQQGIAVVQEAQWGGRGPRWVCFARNHRGTTFSGVSHSRHQARRNAMWRCQRNSMRCFPRGCR